MKKNSRKTTKPTNKNSGTKYENPGRPKYIPAFPRTKEWTFTDFMAANMIQTDPSHKDFGKGPHCTMLTLRKFMARDVAKKAKSLIFRQKGVTSEPNSEDGLGRRAYLYSIRASATVPVPTLKGGTGVTTSTPVARKTRKAKVSASAAVVTDSGVSESTQKYEELKAILSAPTPEVAAPVIPPVTVTVPAVTIAPEVKEETITPLEPALVETVPPVATPETAPISA